MNVLGICVAFIGLTCGMAHESNMSREIACKRTPFHLSVAVAVLLLLLLLL